MINIEEKNEKNRRCDACSIRFDKLYHVIFGHNPNHQSIARFCIGCVSDLKDKLYTMFNKEVENNEQGRKGGV